MVSKKSKVVDQRVENSTICVRSGGKERMFDYMSVLSLEECAINSECCLPMERSTKWLGNRSGRDFTIHVLFVP